MLSPDICRHITAATGRPFRVRREREVAGGCINRTLIVDGDAGRYFVKLNRPALADMFEAEAAGLEEIRKSDTVRSPRPLCWGATEDASYLVLQHVTLRAGTGASQRRLGEQLANLHRCTRPCFGWDRNNTIGATPQVNTQTQDWVVFWRRHRLGFQLELAARNGYHGTLQRQGDRLLQKLEAFFDSYRPLPSLLHGDLWGGNFAMDDEGNPVIYDPAVYYGDRETDIAMTELFGGFGDAFYNAYRNAWPLDNNYKLRKRLYNLYHVLNHLNLFGAGYQAQAESLIQSLSAEVG